VSSTNVYVNDPIIITITGQDIDGLTSLSARYGGYWHTVYVSGTSASRTWTIRESYPGTYAYCGRVSGYQGAYWVSGKDTVYTSPDCIQVQVSEYYYPTPPPAPYCTNECSISGETRCYGSGYIQTCGNYDSDYCLEWSSYQAHSGDTSCGYGVCADNQRPSWYCSGGSFTYNCVYDSSCAPLPPACECTTGPCCDGCHYKSASISCNVDIQTEYGCPWGQGCGSDVGRRTKTRFQYCSGNSAQCTGYWGNWLNWTSWTMADACSTNETCSPGNSVCQYTSSCSQPISNYILHYTKSCFDSDLYWLDSNGARQDKYRDCSDNNNCTIDSCQNSGCVSELKCDGSTCTRESDDYCAICSHCGDDICNCGETAESCAQDCGPKDLVVVILGKTDRNSLKWLKELDLQKNEPVDFLVVVKNRSDKTLDNISVRAELPDDIAYDGGLKMEGVSLSGDIISGVNIGSLGPNSAAALTFKGKTGSGNLEKAAAEVVAVAKSGGLSDTHILAVDFASGGMAGLGLAAIMNFFIGKWYFWVFVVLILLYLFFVVFRRVFSPGAA